jgi:hypothetical protein
MGKKPVVFQSAFDFIWIKVNGWSLFRLWAAIDLFDYFGRHASDNRMGRHILRDNGTGRNNCSLADTDTVGNNSAAPYPDIIFNNYAFGRNTLYGKGRFGSSNR